MRATKTAARSLAALLGAALLLSACSSDGASTAEPATTSTEEPTTSSTSTTSTIPAPADLEPDPGITLDVDPAIDYPKGIDLLVEGMTASRQLTGDRTPITVHVYRNLDHVIDHYVNATGATRSQATEALTNNTAMAYYSGGGSHLYFRHSVFQPFPTSNEIIVSAHEAAHISSNAAFGRDANNTPGNQIRPLGPVWLIEGYAELVGNQVATARQHLPGNVRDFTTIRAKLVTSATKLDTPLENLTTSDEWVAAMTSPDLYPKAYLAAEWLNHRVDGAAMHRTYWERAGQIGWEAAFVETFGLDIASFYTEFAAWASAGYPALP